MTTDARTEILDRIRRATADITNPDPVSDVPITWEYGTGIAMDDVVGTFVEKVEDYKATVVRVAPKDVAAAVVTGLQATGAKGTVVVPPGLDSAWRDAIAKAGLKVAVDDPQLTKPALDAATPWSPHRPAGWPPPALSSSPTCPTRGVVRSPWSRTGTSA